MVVSSSMTRISYRIAPSSSVVLGPIPFQDPLFVHVFPPILAVGNPGDGARRRGDAAQGPEPPGHGDPLGRAERAEGGEGIVDVQALEAEADPGGQPDVAGPGQERVVAGPQGDGREGG